MEILQIIATTIIVAGVIYLFWWSYAAFCRQIKHGHSCCTGQSCCMNDDCDQQEQAKPKIGQE